MTIKKIRSNRAWSIALFLTLLIGALPFNSVYAQSEELQSAREDVIESVSQITLAADIMARREALLNVFTLTLTETSDLASPDKLVAFTESEHADTSSRASQYLSTLNSYRHYIDLLIRQLMNPALALDDLKTMANDFKEWRVNIYDPQAKQIFDFLLFAQAESVFDTADSRFNKIALDLTKLELVASKSDARTLSRTLDGAKKNLDAAKIFQDTVAEIISDDSTSTIRSMPVSLKHGLGGVFTCVSSLTDINICEPIFRKTDGTYFVLKLSPTLARTYSSRFLYQGSGLLVATAPRYIENAPVGVIELTAINELDFSTTAVVPEISDKLLVNEIPARSARERQSLQKLIKQEFSEIAGAYQKFFAMSKIAKKY